MLLAGFPLGFQTFLNALEFFGYLLGDDVFSLLPLLDGLSQLLLHLREILVEVPREDVKALLPELCLPGNFRANSRCLILQVPLHPHVRFFSRLILLRYALRDTCLQGVHFLLLLRE